MTETKHSHGARASVRILLVSLLISFALGVGLVSSVRAGLDDAVFDGPVWAVIEFQGDLVVGGEFTTVDGVTVGGIARWDGAQWHALGSGLAGTHHGSGSNIQDYYDMATQVRALHVHDGLLVVGGCFRSAGGVDTENVAAWDGQTWQSFGDALYDGAGLFAGTGTFRFYASCVYTLASYDDRIIAGGCFDGPDFRLIAGWDGSTWQPVGAELQGGTMITMPLVKALAVYDGRLIAGGFFDAPVTGCSDNLAAWDGTQWTPLANSLDGPVTALTRDGEDLVMLGDFTAINNVFAPGAVTYDGTWIRLPGIPPRAMNVFCRFNDDLFLGSWLYDGSDWIDQLGALPNLSIWRGPVKVLLPWDDKLVVGGTFDELAGRPQPYFGLWDPASAVPVPQDDGTATSLTLAGITPNPANPGTEFVFTAAGSGPVDIGIFDMRGAEVVTLRAEATANGQGRVTWTGRDAAGRAAPSGVYFVRLRQGDAAVTEKFSLVR